MMKYHGPHAEDPNLSNNPMAEAVYNMKMFRAQRNYYITVFTLFMFMWVHVYSVDCPGLSGGYGIFNTDEKVVDHYGIELVY